MIEDFPVEDRAKRSLLEIPFCFELLASFLINFPGENLSSIEFTFFVRKIKVISKFISYMYSGSYMVPIKTYIH